MFFTSQPVFMRVWPSQPDFVGFQVLTPILHVFCVLTRKIGRFYELERIFNNHDCHCWFLVKKYYWDWLDLQT
jgi:hypothetical protein